MPIATRHHISLWLRWTVFVVMLGGFLFLYVESAKKQMRTQLDAQEQRYWRLTEQSAVDLQPDFTHSFSEPLKRMMPHRTDGIAQPLWPWVAAWLYVTDDVPQTLKRAWVFRFALSLGFLVILALTCARAFTLPAALLVVFIAGFHGFLPAVSGFTGATLFQVFFLLCWLCCLYALQRNSLWVYGLVGLFGALAYLSEDRIIPLLLVFTLISTVRAFGGWLMTHFIPRGGTSQWVWRNHFFGLILLISTFGFSAGSRLVEAQAKFGQGFFSYLDLVRWQEDAASAEAWIKKHPDAASLKAIPLHDRLGLRIYLDQHSGEEIMQRLLHGLTYVWGKISQEGGWQIVLLIGILTALLLAAWCGTPRASHAGQRLHPETATSVLFILGVSFTSICIAAWDHLVWDSAHFQALLAPLALSLLWACESVMRRARRRSSARLIMYAYLALLWCMVAADLILHWQARG